MTPTERWHVLLAYLKVKLDEKDWHGVRDAATDIEVLEAKHPELKKDSP